MNSVTVKISNFFLAMQAGRPGAGTLESYFADDAVYEEPFTGQVRRHSGKADIMKAMALGWESPMEDMRLELCDVRTVGGEVHVQWICHSPSIPGGRGSGLNRYTFEGGLITSLVTTLNEQ